MTRQTEILTTTSFAQRILATTRSVMVPMAAALVACSIAVADDNVSETANSDVTISRQALDESVRPQDDLYQYVNGRWLESTEIPGDKSNYGAFTKLADLSQERCRTLIEELVSQMPEEGSDGRKIADFYLSFMNVDLVNEMSSVPLEEHLKKIDAIDSINGLMQHMATLQMIGVDTPFGVYVSQDAKNADRYAVHMIQSGLTLPDRDYYLDSDDRSGEARSALLAYVHTLFTLADRPHGKDEVATILAMETAIAKASWPRVDLRDADKRYNRIEFDQLSEMLPAADVPDWFAALGIPEQDYVIVNTPDFFKALAPMVTETFSLEQWKQYLSFRVIDSYQPYLSDAFVDAGFELYQKHLAGVEEQKPRWERAMNLIAGRGGFGTMGDAVGKLYVEKYFDAEAKAKMDRLVKNLLRAFGESIDGLTWMSDQTKIRAKEKLSKIRTKVGYTKSWRSYDALQVNAVDLFGNVMRSNTLEFQRDVAKLGKPVDREEWGMTPQTVNAYYNPGKNEIVFPAAILQPPFFSAESPTPLNYGGIGAVIGHEISHAFDDQGSKYDGDGNLNQWWTDADRETFGKLTARLVEQYNAYQPLPGKNVNGQFTLGENIADLSGLSIAFKAMQLESLDEDSQVAGWSNDQLFFVGWSRVWKRKYRDAEMIKRLLTDPHSPSRYRANGPVTNMDAFYRVFNVKEGDALFTPPEQRITIW